MSPSRTVQRLVAVASDLAELDDDDVSLYHMIDYAFRMAGGPIVDFAHQPDFSRLRLDETFYILEHGRRGVIERSKMSDLTAALTRDGTGLPAGYHGTIIVTACWGAVRGSTGNTDSAIEQLAKGLKEKRPGVTIVGAKGPTMFASHFPSGFEVLNPETQYHMSYNTVLAEAGFKQKKGEWMAWLKLNRNASLDVKAARCVEIFRSVQTTAREAMVKGSYLFTSEQGKTLAVVS
jgi:hypothetical protein